MKQFRNLIFDLGGVIIDLSVEETVKSFALLSGLPEQEIYGRYHAHPEFLAYEKGQLSNKEFRASVKRIFSFQSTDEEFDRAWNAMLVGLPVRKLELLTRLKKQFTLTVLSNTNGIHLHHVNSVMLPNGNVTKSLNDYFHQHYYSHLLNKRKPEPEIFQQVIDENNFDPARTLFLDDNLLNVKAARDAGMHAWVVEHPGQVFDFFERV